MKKTASLLLLLAMLLCILPLLASCKGEEDPPLFNPGGSNTSTQSKGSQSSETTVVGETSGKVFYVTEEYFLMRDRKEPTRVYQVNYSLSVSRFGKEPNLVVGYSERNEEIPYPSEYPNASDHTVLIVLKGEFVEKDLFVDDLPNDLDIPGGLS